MVVDIEDLYRRWVRSFGEERINLKFPSLRGLMQWFLRQCELKGIDPETIDFEAFVDPALTYAENKTILAEMMEAPMTEAEAEEHYEEYKGILERQVREKYGEIVEPWLERIAELERTEKLAKKRYKRIKELERELSETERKLEEERVKPPEVALVRIRILKSFREGIIDYTVGSVVESRDIDWVLELIDKGLAERVAPEMPPIKVVPPTIPIEKGLTEGDLKALEDYARRLLGTEIFLRHQRNIRADIRSSSDLYKDELRSVAYEKAGDRLDKFIERLKVEEKIVAPPVEEKVRPAVTPRRAYPPREPKLITRRCWICGETFEVDYDLEQRLRFSEVLRFPDIFYQLCPEHKKNGGIYMGKSIAPFGYDSIEDAVAFRLVDSRIMSPYKPGLKGVDAILTEDRLREIGLTEEDISKLWVKTAKYML